MKEMTREEIIRALEDLTPGGSEFYNNPARCIQFIKERRESLETNMKRAIRERNEAQGQCAALERVMSRLLKIARRLAAQSGRSDLFTEMDDMSAALDGDPHAEVRQ